MPWPESVRAGGAGWVHQMKAEEDRLRGQLATKMAEGVEIETVYNNASQEARQVERGGGGVGVSLYITILCG